MAPHPKISPMPDLTCLYLCSSDANDEKPCFWDKNGYFKKKKCQKAGYVQRLAGFVYWQNGKLVLVCKGYTEKAMFYIPSTKRFQMDLVPRFFARSQRHRLLCTLPAITTLRRPFLGHYFLQLLKQDSFGKGLPGNIRPGRKLNWNAPQLRNWEGRA